MSDWKKCKDCRKTSVPPGAVYCRRCLGYEFGK